MSKDIEIVAVEMGGSGLRGFAETGGGGEGQGDGLRYRGEEDTSIAFPHLHELYTKTTHLSKVFGHGSMHREYIVFGYDSD